MSSSDAAHLWLALQVYQRLGQHFRLPVRIPQAVLDTLSAHLTPADLAAADVAAEQVMAGLRRALDGEIPFPVWTEPALPVERILTVIEQALSAGQPLELEYYAASTDTVTHRVVEPYRIEQHGETAYLIGFCRQAQAERMFRLDRMRAIEVVETTDMADPNPLIP